MKKRAEYISVQEAAEWLGFKVVTIRRWVKDGKIKAYRVTPHSQIRLKVAELEALFQSGSTLNK